MKTRGNLKNSSLDIELVKLLKLSIIYLFKIYKIKVNFLCVKPKKNILGFKMKDYYKVTVLVFRSVAIVSIALPAIPTFNSSLFS